MTLRRNCQHITIVLESGKEISAFVPVFCSVEELDREGVRVLEVRASPPMELPEGCAFEDVTLLSPEPTSNKA